MPLTSAPKRAQLVKTLGKTSEVVLHGFEKATQTWKIGAFLIDDGAGRLTVSTSPIDASAVDKRTLGMALADATGVTDADVPFAFVGADVVFMGTLSDSTAGTHTLALTDLYETFPIVLDGAFSTGFYYLDANAVSDTGGALVIGLVDPIGTVNGRVQFIVTTPARGTANAGSANI